MLTLPRPDLVCALCQAVVFFTQACISSEVFREHRNGNNGEKESEGER